MSIDDDNCWQREQSTTTTIIRITNNAASWQSRENSRYNGEDKGNSYRYLLCPSPCACSREGTANTVVGTARAAPTGNGGHPRIREFTGSHMAVVGARGAPLGRPPPRVRRRGPALRPAGGLRGGGSGRGAMRASGNSHQREFSARRRLEIRVCTTLF